MKYLYYTVVNVSSPTKALLVLDEEGKLYYASLGSNSDLLRKILVKDFQPIKTHKLKSLSTIGKSDQIQSTIAKYIDIYNDPYSTNDVIPIEIIFGTSLQRKVWDKLLTIPLGKTMNYSSLAESLNIPKSRR
ncbi:MGT1 [[Candida] subhashii]|uniref:Methylated-DNA--protein-cysteine methyltransferase n=1 Tax=[Candida] subhashii TaxID=561895 RepID=A0A8J5UII8_9ASCO|nr:MGT1 [[Candida] subhashii]KAG7663663.1 MGT1 [[Candida] subhashii]